MNDSVVTRLRPKRPCPECNRPAQRDTFPFCSVRCSEVDLGRWLSGSYVIPGRDDEIDDVASALENRSED